MKVNKTLVGSWKKKFKAIDEYTHDVFQLHYNLDIQTDLGSIKYWTF